MDRKRARELITILQAWVDGKTIQKRRVGDNPRDWHDWDGTIPMFDHKIYEYRIKPEPRVVWMYETEDDHPTDAWLSDHDPSDDDVEQFDLVKFQEVLE